MRKFNILSIFQYLEALQLVQFQLFQHIFVQFQGFYRTSNISASVFSGTSVPHVGVTRPSKAGVNMQTLARHSVARATEPAR